MFIITYDTQQFPFAEMIADILNVRRLDEVHKLVTVPEELFVPGGDQNTTVHNAFYAEMGRILPLYRTFVREVLAPHVKGEGPLVYQKTPTFRVHLPGNVAVGAFHVDSQYDHQPAELNFWVPLTPTMAENTIHIESEPGKGDHAPVCLSPGQVLLFEGSKYSHGNVKNTSKVSRVSFDLRALRMSQYDPDWARASRNTAKRFVIGGYYARMDGRGANAPGSP